MIEVLAEHGIEEIAKVYVGRLEHSGMNIEFAESLQFPIPRDEKWVLIVSSMHGCPVRCLFCDAGGDYRGPMSAEEILAQVDYMVLRRYPDGRVPASKFKVQFARVGEPSMNWEVLRALRMLRHRYSAPGLLPCLSTIAPAGREAFFNELLNIKEEIYAKGRFQLQFSLHSTSEEARAVLIPVRKWGLEEIAAYGEDWVQLGDRKIALNFAAAEGVHIEPEVLRMHFDPARFIIKLTPVNPTARAMKHGIASRIDPYDPATAEPLAERLRGEGFEVIVSIGNPAENSIGSNCGQYLGYQRTAL
ncbi:MAG: radical SAM protein [Candidatus Thermoplasmatota archaeon]